MAVFIGIAVKDSAFLLTFTDCFLQDLYRLILEAPLFTGSSEQGVISSCLKLFLCLGIDSICQTVYVINIIKIDRIEILDIRVFLDPVQALPHIFISGRHLAGGDHVPERVIRSDDISILKYSDGILLVV